MGEFGDRYAQAFEAFIADRSEVALDRAYELGRRAVADDVSLMEIVDAHHAALIRMGAPAVAQAAGDFLREALATYELAARGFLEAQETARLEAEHAQLQQQLAEASLAINASLSAPEILRVAAEQAHRIVSAEHAEADILLPASHDPIVFAAAGMPQKLLRVAYPSEAPEPGADAAQLEAPLVGRGGQRLGTLSVCRPAARTRAAQEPVLVQLAQMASVAIENAQRYARERAIAETLQRSLLPPRLPAIPGMDLAARFWPAGDGIQVGGDFYDVFQVGAHDWAVVIGDVCGKGPEAAALTALTRYTVRAVALNEPSPAAVLEALNAAMLEQRADNRFATVLYARLELDPGAGGGARLTAASGGHPLPLLVRPGGAVAPVGRGGTLLGVLPHPAIADAQAEMAPGDTLVLYTDGVVEVRARGRELFGAADLARLLAGSAGLAPDALLARIEDRVLLTSGGHPHDDVALLGLRVR